MGYADVNKYETKQDRREGHYMTMTTTETTNREVTLDTPEGTLLRLVDDNSMTAKAGALGVVGDGTKANRFRYLDVRWLKGHHHPEGKAVSQMDGGYFPSQFEIHEFQVGDRVRVTSTYEAGYEGIIESFAPSNGDDCKVRLDNGLCLSYRFKHLVKVEEVSEDDEPLAEWEKESLGLTPEPEPVDPFSIGDIVVIDGCKVRGNLTAWEGLRFEVAGTLGVHALFLKDGVIDTRPDGLAVSNFYWDRALLRAFDPARDFKAGDIVDSPRYSSKGVVTNPYLSLGGDIEIDWTEGHESLVAYGPIGANRKYLTLIGTQPEAEPEPEPVREDWSFEAGQEIGSSDVLEDLPMGTVLIIGTDDESPVIKLEAGFARINRWGIQHDGRLVAYDETDSVKSVADGGTPLVIAFVPSE